MKAARIFLVFPVVYGLLNLSCSSGTDQIERVVVSGEVTYEGAPLEKGNLSIIPEEGTAAPPSGAEIVLGKYCIKNKGGVVPGNYLVRITADRMIPGATPSDPDSVPMEQYIPAKYNQSTTLKLNVPSGKTGIEADFNLK